MKSVNACSAVRTPNCGVAKHARNLATQNVRVKCAQDLDGANIVRICAPAPPKRNLSRALATDCATWARKVMATAVATQAGGARCAMWNATSALRVAVHVVTMVNAFVSLVSQDCCVEPNARVHGAPRVADTMRHLGRM